MKRLSESIFNAGIERNQGNEVKKEDEVDLLGKEGFYNYLIKHYESLYSNKSIYLNRHCIEVPISKIQHVGSHTLQLYFVDDEISNICFSVTFSDEIMNFIQENYKIIKREEYVARFQIRETITGKKITNSNCIEIIDFITSNTEIPHLRKINESIFNAGVERNQGNGVKKEDDVNLMNCEDFRNYLISEYVKRDTNVITYKINNLINFYKLSADSEELTINIGPSCWMKVRYGDNKVKEIKIGSYSTLRDHVNLISDIKKKYILTVTDMTTALKASTDKGLENKDIENILSIMLNDIPLSYIRKGDMKKVSESIFNAGVERNQGNEVKKEDDINLLDLYSFKEYIEKNYEIKFTKIYFMDDYMDIPLVEKNSNVKYYMRYDGNTLSASILFKTNFEDVWRILQNNFNCIITENEEVEFSSKTGNVSNKVCLELIDNIIENVEHPLLKKK